MTRHVRHTGLPELEQAGLYAVVVIPHGDGVDPCFGLGTLAHVPKARNGQKATIWEWGIMQVHTPGVLQTSMKRKGRPMRVEALDPVRKTLHGARPEDQPAIPLSIARQLLRWYRDFTPRYLPEDNWPHQQFCEKTAKCNCSKCGLVKTLLQHSMKELLPVMMMQGTVHGERVQLTVTATLAICSGQHVQVKREARPWVFWQT